jgi:hypothetical protein
MHRIYLVRSALLLSCFLAPAAHVAAQSHALPPPVGGITFDQVFDSRGLVFLIP